MSVETYSQDLGPDRAGYVIRDNGGVARAPMLTDGQGAAFGALVSFWCDRARDLLPTVDVGTAVAYVIALQQHAVIGNRETFAELLRTTLDVDHLSADDIARCAMFDTAAERGYLASDDSLYLLNPTRCEATTMHKRRTDGTVKGRRDAHVIGNNGDAGAVDSYGAMSASEAREHAALWLHTDADGTADLIGTDEYSWSEVVTFKPDTFALIDGALILAPYDGRRVDGGDGRKRVAWRTRRATYEHRPRETDDITTWGADGDSLRIVKRYRTSFDGRSVIGHGTWSDGRRARSTVAKARRASIATVDTVHAVQAITDTLGAAYDAGTAATVRYHIAGTAHTVIATVEPERRRYRVVITTAVEGAKSVRHATTTRTLTAATAYATRHTAA